MQNSSTGVKNLCNEETTKTDLQIHFWLVASWSLSVLFVLELLLLQNYAVVFHAPAFRNGDGNPLVSTIHVLQVEAKNCLPFMRCS